jgi:hypothetical protein
MLLLWRLAGGETGYDRESLATIVDREKKRLRKSG